MKVKILHLYSDFMNLYGEVGNVRIMQRRLEDQGFTVEVINSTVSDPDIKFDVDFVYMGSGYESNRDIAAAHLGKFKRSLVRAVIDGVPMLFTGNSFDLLGKGVTNADGKFIEGLDIFNYTFKEQREKRYTGDVVLQERATQERYVGFVNRAGIPDSWEDMCCEVIKVIGNVPVRQDAARVHNLFGVSLIGPVLLKNPKLADDFVKEICERKNAEYQEISYPRSEKSHDKTLKALLETDAGKKA